MMSTPAQALKRSPGAMEEALSRLRAQIVEGDLLPGEQIRQQQMAEQFGVSRVPLREALKVLEELQIEGVTVVAVAKGTTRRPGLETLVVGLERRERVLAPDSTALHLIQQVRDEAHRFAISALQKRRGKKSRASPLEGIAGVGPKRRRELLRYFGGLQGIERASLEELVRVPTISRRIAEDVYAAFHNQ